MDFYKMHRNELENTLTIEFIDDVKSEQVPKYFQEYKKHLEYLNVSEAVLILEMERMPLSPAEVISKLRQVSTVYRDTGFKKIMVTVCTAQKVLKEEIEKLIKLENITMMEVVPGVNF